MTAIVECRRCGTEFEVDVLALAGRWWDQCPHCNEAASAPDAEESEEQN